MLNAFRALRGFLQRRETQMPVRPKRRTQLTVESLENRRVLAAGALPGIQGTVFADANNNGTVDTGEGIAGAAVQLFLDDGDGIFEPGTDDTQVGTDATTDANGVYCFDGLVQDSQYFVQQPQQTVGGVQLQQQVSSAIVFEPQLIIDTFETTQATAAFPPPVSSDESSLTFPNENEAIGAERDLAVELQAGTSEVQLRVNPFGLDDVLIFDSSAGTAGTREVTWDGVDADGDVLALGLNGRDLTQGGTLSGLTMRMGVDANGADAIFRFYQGSTTTFSEVTVPIPVTGGAATEWVFVPFSDFSGPVNASDVDAIQLILETGNRSVDGQIDVVGALGANIANFDNDVVVDLELQKDVNATEVTSGDQVTWTLTLTNNAATATATAANVTVSDVLPTGVSFVSASATDGVYQNDTWTLANPLAPGDTETLTLLTTVNSGLNGGTVIENVAEVSSHDGPDIDSAPNNDDGDQSEDDEDNAQITVGEFVDVELTKVVDSATANAGDQVTFTITATNNAANANTDATGVQITDTLPSGLTFVSATPSGNGTFNNGVWSLVDSLAPGTSETLSVVATIDSSVVGDTKLTNVAEVSALNEQDVDSTPNNDDGDQSEDDEAMAMLMVGAVIDLEVSKVANVTDVSAGDTVVWTVTVVNNAATANAAATNVQISDAVPTGTTFVSATPSGNGTFSNGIWSLVDPLQPGSSATLTITTTVNTGLAGGAKVVNTAQVTAADQNDPDSTPNNDDGDQSEDDEAMAMVQLNPQIDLELTKTASATTVLPGDPVTWTITLTNNAANANTDATGVQVSDALPTGVTFVSATPSSGTFNGDTWTLGGAIAPGATETLSLLTTVDANVTNNVENVAEVSAANEPDIDSQPGNDDGDQSQDDEDNAIVQIDPLVIDLELSKSVNATTVTAGDQVTWTITLSNNAANANTDATGVQVSDVLPAGVTFVSATPSSGTFSGNTWTLGSSIAPGGSETLNILTTANSNAGTSAENVAQVSAANETDIDSTPNNDDGDQSEDDEDNASIQINPLVIDLELNKTVNAPTVSSGDSVTWTLTLTNNQANANADATGVQVTDVLPAGVTFVSANPSSGTFSSGTWVLGSALSPGDTETLGITTTVNSNVAGGDTLINTAQVSAANESDIDSQTNNDDGDQSQDDEDNAQISVNSVIDVNIDKSVDQSNVVVGDTVTWTIVVANDAATANTAATGVTVRDVLPNGVSFVSSNTTNGSYNAGTGIWTLANSLAPGASATLTLVSTVSSATPGTNLLNVAEVATHNESDIDSSPGNDDGDQNEDDEDAERLNVGFARTLSKRDLLASS